MLRVVDDMQVLTFNSFKVATKKMEIPFLVIGNCGNEIIGIISCDLFIIGLIISCDT